MQNNNYLISVISVHVIRYFPSKTRLISQQLHNNNNKRRFEKTSATNFHIDRLLFFLVTFRESSTSKSLARRNLRRKASEKVLKPDCPPACTALRRRLLSSGPGCSESSGSSLNWDAFMSHPAQITFQCSAGWTAGSLPVCACVCVRVYVCVWRCVSMCVRVWLGESVCVTVCDCV